MRIRFLRSTLLLLVLLSTVPAFAQRSSASFGRLDTWYPFGASGVDLRTLAPMQRQTYPTMHFRNTSVYQRRFNRTAGDAFGRTELYDAGERRYIGMMKLAADGHFTVRLDSLLAEAVLTWEGLQLPISQSNPYVENLVLFQGDERHLISAFYDPKRSSVHLIAHDLWVGAPLWTYQIVLTEDTPQNVILSAYQDKLLVETHARTHQYLHVLSSEDGKLRYQQVY